MIGKLLNEFPAITVLCSDSLATNVLASVGGSWNPQCAVRVNTKCSAMDWPVIEATTPVARKMSASAAVLLVKAV